MWTSTHFRRVLVGWAVVLVVFGVFAPRVEGALAGAGWQDSTSQSVAARNLIAKDFRGLGSTALQVVVVDHRGPFSQDPGGRYVIDRVESGLRADRRVSTVEPPQPGSSLSADGRTAVITGGAAAGPNTMVRAADSLAKPLSMLSTSAVSVELTGDSALWSQFNTANRSAMLRSEVLSWPVTMIILVVAFGSLVAAGLPLMLTMAGLLVAAGALVLATKVAPVSIWALNFALMFALALGIDYALFLVVRFRSALERRHVQPGDRAGAGEAVAETMNTAGKAIAFSAVTVLLSLSAVLLVPSPAFRSMALGIMLSVVAVLAATLTLLPAVLARLGTRVNAGHVRLPRRGRDTQSSAGLEGRLGRWGHLLWEHPWRSGTMALVALGVVIVPLFGLRTSMPSISIIPSSTSARIGYGQVGSAFGPGAPGTLQVVVPSAEQTAAMTTLTHTAGVAQAGPGRTSGGYTLDQVVPTTGPSSPVTGATIDHLRAVLPPGSLVGGAVAENYDLQTALSARTPMVFGLLLAVGFLMLLIALGAPLLALAGVAVTALSVAGAFGVARLIFQSGHGSTLLGFAPQGFVDAWGPIFFGAMVSGVAMDYTLFLLSSAKEHYETGRDPCQAMINSVRTSGRVVVSAAVIMVAVFLTFALSGPLAPKEMGVILAVAVAIDAIIVRMALLPILLRVGGHRIWAQPAWLGKILPDIRFAH
ncbi:MAG: MMPL family transporter [Actinomycetota bacterium]|nr:MMPL family transporter [Actinomycetota bacterium]